MSHFFYILLDYILEVIFKNHREDFVNYLSEIFLKKSEKSISPLNLAIESSFYELIILCNELKIYYSDKNVLSKLNFKNFLFNDAKIINLNTNFSNNFNIYINAFLFFKGNKNIKTSSKILESLIFGNLFCNPTDFFDKKLFTYCSPILSSFIYEVYNDKILQLFNNKRFNFNEKNLFILLDKLENNYFDNPIEFYQKFFPLSNIEFPNELQNFINFHKYSAKSKIKISKESLLKIFEYSLKNEYNLIVNFLILNNPTFVFDFENGILNFILLFLY